MLDEAASPMLDEAARPMLEQTGSPSELSVPNHETASSNNGLSTTLSNSKRKSTSFLYLNLSGNQKEEKALKEQILNWIKSKSGGKVVFASNDFIVRQNRVQCLKCTTPSKIKIMSLHAADGKWKISNFTRHLTECHQESGAAKSVIQNFFAPKHASQLVEEIELSDDSSEPKEKRPRTTTTEVGGF